MHFRMRERSADDDYQVGHETRCNGPAPNLLTASPYPLVCCVGPHVPHYSLNLAAAEPPIMEDIGPAFSTANSPKLSVAYSADSH